MASSSARSRASASRFCLRFLRRPSPSCVLAAATAALIGLPGAIFSVGAGALVGTFYGIGLALSTGRRLRRLTIPFGPFLAGAALVWMFAGEWILRWYLQFCRLAQ